ncbi:MAG: hypothetical protein Q9212_005533 [Teloschistes hypoglaucus]
MDHPPLTIRLKNAPNATHQTSPAPNPPDSHSKPATTPPQGKRNRNRRQKKELHRLAREEADAKWGKVDRSQLRMDEAREASQKRARDMGLLDMRKKMDEDFAHKLVAKGYVKVAHRPTGEALAQLQARSGGPPPPSVDGLGGNRCPAAGPPNMRRSNIMSFLNKMDKGS